MKFPKGLGLIFIFLLIPISSPAQDSIPASSEKLLIGITPTPPFITEENGKFSGLSISSWKLVNQQLNADFEYKVYNSLTELMAAVETGEVDFSINPITVTDQRMQRLDFSQPYFISYTGVVKKSDTSVWTYLSNILSWNFISAILILLGVIFIFGLLVWLFERKRNPEQFGGGTRGVFQGFWWSAVTMTTVGYGDKAPLTLGGRIVGLIWMFLAIIMISSLTAGIASSLTVQNIYDEINSVQDLNRFDVVTVSGSSALELLEQYNISSDEVINEREGIQEILDDNYSLFVYDQPILRYEIDRRELGDEIELLQRTLKRDYYSYSFPIDSELVDIVNPILVSTLKTMEWNNLVRDYN